MFTRVTHGARWCLSIAVLLFLAAGCEKKETVQPEKDASPAETVVKSDTADAADTADKADAADAADTADTADAADAADGFKVILAKADAMDGEVDNVVTKCGSCRLGMNGKAEHAVKAHGYTMHFCSAGCKTGFEKDLDKSILALNVPQS